MIHTIERRASAPNDEVPDSAGRFSPLEVVVVTSQHTIDTVRQKGREQCAKGMAA